MSEESTALANRAGAVAIARDVLKHLADLKLERRGYVRWAYGTLGGGPTEAHERQLQELEAEIRPHCQVCLLGACLMAKVRLYNDLRADALFPSSWRDSYSLLDGEYYASADSDVVVGELEKYFGPRNLDLMECAFELNAKNCRDPHQNEEYLAAVGFGLRACKTAAGNEDLEQEATVRAVMENVVANGGEFLPEAITEDEFRSEFAERNGRVSDFDMGSFMEDISIEAGDYEDGDD